MAILGIYVEWQGGVGNLAAHCTSCEYLAWTISSQTSPNAQFCSSVSQGLLYVIFKHHKTSLSTMLFLLLGGYIQPPKPQGENNGDIYSKAHKEEQKPTKLEYHAQPRHERCCHWCHVPLNGAQPTQKSSYFPCGKHSLQESVRISESKYLAKLWYFANLDFHEILENSMPQLPFGVRSCEVVIIWPEIVHEPSISSSWEEFPTIRSGWGGGTPTWHLVSQNEGSQQKTHRESASCACLVSKRCWEPHVLPLWLINQSPPNVPPSEIMFL